ncbi:MAG: gamma-glutamyl-gamma-aminobutyrate hydrolase family protein [Dehalococcoidia bacterium]
MTNERVHGHITQVRPTVLITRAEVIPYERWEDYADRVLEAGARPLEYRLEQWLAGTPVPAHEGLLMTAGVDIDPARYGEEPDVRTGEPDPQRDAFDFALLESALERDLPVFAICRSHQLLNVAYGGSLLQHLEDREPHRARRGADGETIESGWHDVDLAPGSRLARLLGRDRVRTNSRHHQAVTLDRVAPGLTVTGTTGDVVEALEDTSKTWVQSVQWHPERPENAAPFKALFEDFAAACADAALRVRGESR